MEDGCSKDTVDSGKANPHIHQSVGGASIPLPDLIAYEPRAINKCLHVDHAQPWAGEGKSRGFTSLDSVADRGIYP